MTISILTLFPDMFTGPFDYSIINNARQNGLVTINFVNIRDFATDAYKSVDDHPYGGGHGMIMRVDVIDRAIEHTIQSYKPFPASQASPESGGTIKQWIILLDPTGKVYTQAKAREYTKLDHLILICGHYEGVDERVASRVDEEISIGDYILTGGELPAMVLVDSVVRLLPGVLPDGKTTNEESFSPSPDGRLLEYPQYTRPPTYKGMVVPEALRSGDHKKIRLWQQNQAHEKTKNQRPDLITGARKDFDS